MSEKPTHYLCITESSVGTKEASFFIEQGGLRQPWGKHWEPVVAENLYAARNIGIKLRRERFPKCHKTMGEDGEAPESYWPEARGQ